MNVARFLGVRLSICVALVVGGGTAAVLPFSGGAPAKPTEVLGEHFSVSGNGNGSAGAPPDASAKSGNANSNSNGNTSGSPGKAFTISGTLNGIFPGVTSKLYLTVTNPNNQAISITNLSATVTSVTKALDAPAGTCAASASNLVIQSFTGPAFTVAANSSRSSSPAYVPVLTPPSAANACQGATFTLTYGGNGSQT